MRESLPAFFTKEWPWSICSCCSWQKCDRSDSLFSKSESIFRFFAHKKRAICLKNQKANSQPCQEVKCPGKESNWVKSDGSNSLFWHKNGEKRAKTYEKYVFFSKSLVFWERFAGILSKSLMPLFLKKKISMICSLLLFWKERQKRDSLRVIFLKIDEINLLTVALFLRATIANRSQLLFLKDQQERKSDKAKSKRANSQPCLLDFLFARNHCFLDNSPLECSVC